MKRALWEYVRAHGLNGAITYGGPTKRADIEASTRDVYTVFVLGVPVLGGHWDGRTEMHPITGGAIFLFWGRPPDRRTLIDWSK